jgi:hypothetical protein
MKKIMLLLIVAFSAQIIYSQSSNVNVTFGKPNPIGDAMNQVQQNEFRYRELRIKEAEAKARNTVVVNETKTDIETKTDSYSKVSTDNLINNSNNYKYLIVENVSGWKPDSNKEDLLKLLIGANKYKIIDISKDYKSNGKEMENSKNIPIELINNKEVLFINWLREAPTDDDRVTQLSVKNSEGKMVYESTSKNLSSSEILKPLTSNYIYSKEQALSRIVELKKYLDLGIITKEEYDLKVAELKPILLGNN